MAVEQDIVIAVATNNSGKLRLSNVNEKYRWAWYDCACAYEVKPNAYN